MNLYLCSTEAITTFHSLSVSGATMNGYSNMVLMMSCYMFFFSKNIAYRLFVSAFIAKTSNSIMKSAMFCFFCLKNSNFHSVSTTFVLLLNVILISLINLF